MDSGVASKEDGKDDRPGAWNKEGKEKEKEEGRGMKVEREARLGRSGGVRRWGMEKAAGEIGWQNILRNDG